MTTHSLDGGAVLDGSGQPLDRIELVGISATGFHGVLDHERRDGQTFRADVVVHLDTRRAAAGDDLTRTLHYGVLAERIAAVLSGDPVNLIETVAEQIAATALAHPAVVAVDVRVHKPQAPITVPFEDVTVTIRRDRTKLPAAEPWPAPATAGAVGAGHEGGAAHAARSAHAAPSAHSAHPEDLDGAAEQRERDRLDEAPAEPVEVVLGLGSNLGASQNTLRAAVETLRSVDGLEIVAISPLARTAPVGGPAQPDFLNAVVLARTTLSPSGLLRAVQRIENVHGRARNERWGPRTLDIDLIVYGSILAVTADLELPHPRAHERAFVLQPWAQIAPDAVLPGLGGGPVAALAATAPDRDGVRWLALDWLTAPPRHPDSPLPDERETPPAPAARDLPVEPLVELVPVPEPASEHEEEAPPATSWLPAAPDGELARPGDRS